MVPYTGGTPQIINDMMGKKGSAQAKLLIAHRSFIAQRA
jgi:hypothetical protein